MREKEVQRIHYAFRRREELRAEGLDDDVVEKTIDEEIGRGAVSKAADCDGRPIDQGGLMSTTVRKRALQLVPKAEGGIDADMVAFTVMEHIDTMYPAMWLSVPKTVRVSVRNTIVRAIRTEEGKL